MSKTKTTINRDDTIKVCGTNFHRWVLPDYLEMIRHERDHLMKKWGEDMTASRKLFVGGLNDKITEIQKILDNE